MVGKKTEIETVKFNIPGFDELFTNPLRKNSSVLITGDPGTGKTSLIMQALYQQKTEKHKKSQKNKLAK